MQGLSTWVAERKEVDVRIVDAASCCLPGVCFTRSESPFS